MDKIRKELAEEIVIKILFNDCKGEKYYRKEVGKLLLEYDKFKDKKIKKLRNALELTIELIHHKQGRYGWEERDGAILNKASKALKDGE